MVRASNFSYDCHLLHNIFTSNEENKFVWRQTKLLPNNKRFVCVWGTWETLGEVSIIERGELKKRYCVSIETEAFVSSNRY